MRREADITVDGVAEGVGFEPTVACTTPVFKTPQRQKNLKSKTRMTRTNPAIHQQILWGYGIASSCVVCEGCEGKRLQKRLHINVSPTGPKGPRIGHSALLLTYWWKPRDPTLNPRA